MLVEKPYILNPHETATCARHDEHAIQDARSHVGLEGLGGGRPSGCAGRETSKPEEYGETANPGRKPDGKDATHAQHESQTFQRISMSD